MIGDFVRQELSEDGRVGSGTDIEDRSLSEVIERYLAKDFGEWGGIAGTRIV